MALTTKTTFGVWWIPTMKSIQWAIVRNVEGCYSHHWVFEWMRHPGPCFFWRPFIMQKWLQRTYFSQSHQLRLRITLRWEWSWRQSIKRIPNSYVLLLLERLMGIWFMWPLMDGEGHSTTGVGMTLGIYFLLDGVLCLVILYNPRDKCFLHTGKSLFQGDLPVVVIRQGY